MWVTFVCGRRSTSRLGCAPEQMRRATLDVPQAPDPCRDFQHGHDCESRGPHSPVMILIILDTNLYSAFSLSMSCCSPLFLDLSSPSLYTTSPTHAGLQVSISIYTDIKNHIWLMLTAWDFKEVDSRSVTLTVSQQPPLGSH